MNKEKIIKEFDKLWQEEMEVIRKTNYPPNFTYLYSVCKRITEKILKSQRKEIINHWIASKRKRNGTAQGCLDMVDRFDNYIKNLVKDEK